MTLIRKCKLAQTGWNNGDLDVAFQLFSCGMVWDGNLTSKDSRDHLVREGYAVRAGGKAEAATSAAELMSDLLSDRLSTDLAAKYSKPVGEIEQLRRQLRRRHAVRKRPSS